MHLIRFPLMPEAELQASRQPDTFPFNALKVHSSPSDRQHLQEVFWKLCTGSRREVSVFEGLSRGQHRHVADDLVRLRERQSWAFG